MSLAFEMKKFYVWKGESSKSHDSQIVPKCNFENGGINIQMGILQVLLNILSTSLLLRVNDTSGYFEMQKE